MGKKKKDAVDIAAQQRAQEQAEVEQAFLTGINTLRDLIAPSSLEFHSSYFRLGTKYGQTIYVYGYPRQLYTGWASPILNADEVLDVSMFIYPVETSAEKLPSLKPTFRLITKRVKLVTQRSRLL